jgi:hypothetical protein
MDNSNKIINEVKTNIEKKIKQQIRVCNIGITLCVILMITIAVVDIIF